jgi:Family of unknown function (DUF5989)
MLQKFFNPILTRFSIIGELFAFLWARRLWWLMPMTAMLVLLGVLMLITQSSALAPFIYPLF